jgi:response regulator RpfG family c-di-GMP phosphodiesterase
VASDAKDLAARAAATLAPAASAAGEGDLPESWPAILLVEDELTARQLRRAGYRVEVVENGAEALALLKRKFFPMLLTDWDMPQMNGAALAD